MIHSTAFPKQRTPFIYLYRFALGTAVLNKRYNIQFIRLHHMLFTALQSTGLQLFYWILPPLLVKVLFHFVSGFLHSL